MRAVPLQGLYSTAHSKHRCPEDVEFVDIFHRADANAEAESRLADLHLQNRAARRCQLLAVVQAIRHSPPVENHRSGHDRPSQRPATRLIYTGHRAIMKVLMKEIRHGEAFPWDHARRSEEHTSELQSLMRISYAVFCLKKKKHKK